MTDREAMCQALEALADYRRELNDPQPCDAEKSLIKRLAQPEDEPVAWRYRGNLHEFDPSDWAEGPVTPLYTRPQPAAWVGLTDEEVEALASWWPSYDQMPALKVLIKDVTNSLKEKNT